MPRWKHWFILLFLSLLVAMPIVFLGWAWAALNYAYARGERAGYVQKISQKGWLCKTWEGELAMVNLPGTLPQIFSFTVRDPSTAHDVEHLIGQRVSLSYEQHKGLPSSCFGETEYFVTRISAVADAAVPPPLGASSPSPN